MDGVSFDLLHQHLKTGQWQGLLVEPVPEMFTRLCENYANCPSLRAVNCAVADYDGTLSLYQVDPAFVENGLLPPEALGATSAYPDKGTLALLPPDENRQHHIPTRFLRKIDVPCVRLPNLLQQENVSSIDCIMIDAEGADWMIARQLDLTRYQPSLICLEFTNLRADELAECLQHFIQSGYSYALCEEDRQNLLFYKQLT